MEHCLKENVRLFQMNGEIERMNGDSRSVPGSKDSFGVCLTLSFFTSLNSDIRSAATDLLSTLLRLV